MQFIWIIIYHNLNNKGRSCVLTVPCNTDAFFPSQSGSQKDRHAWSWRGGGGQNKTKNHLLFTLQITCELDSVPETTQRMHAVQHIWVQLSQGQDSPHTHSPGRRLLRTRLITTTPGSHRHTERITKHTWMTRVNKYDATSLKTKSFIQEWRDVYSLIPGVFLDGL